MYIGKDDIGISMYDLTTGAKEILTELGMDEGQDVNITAFYD